VGERAFQLARGLGRERPRQIEAADFRAERRRRR
jgi:hypothetical protein